MALNLACKYRSLSLSLYIYIYIYMYTSLEQGPGGATSPCPDQTHWSCRSKWAGPGFFLSFGLARDWALKGWLRDQAFYVFCWIPWRI